MDKKTAFTKFLAVAGTVLIWLPMLAPLVFGLISLADDGRFRFDYLIPAELFPVVLLGGLLLLWAAWRAKAEKGLIGWGFLSIILMLVISQGVAVLTGLASGETEPGGWQMTLVLVFLGLFWLGLIAVGVGGIRLARRLFGPG
jgi:hypothetical protein